MSSSAVLQYIILLHSQTFYQYNLHIQNYPIGEPIGLISDQIPNTGYNKMVLSQIGGRGSFIAVSQVIIILL